MFARTSVLVVATGLFHGILLLPIIIRSFAFEAPTSEIKAVFAAKIKPVETETTRKKGLEFIEKQN
jgi:hypothetical protein